MPGTTIVQDNFFAVNFLFGPGRIVRADHRKVIVFSNPHFPEKKVLEPVRGNKSFPGIFGKIVGNLRSLQSQAIPNFRQGNPIVAVRCLLDEKTAPKLTRELFVQPLDQLGTEQSLADGSRVKLASIHAVDEVERRYVGIGAACDARYDEIPALIADVHTKRAALAAERSVTQISDTRSDQWTAIGIQRLRRQAPCDIIRVIHQVSPDHVAAVRHAVVCSAAVFRHQQQSRRLYRIRRDHIDLGLHKSTFGFRPCVKRNIILIANKIDLADAAVFADDDLAGDRSLPHFYEAGSHRIIQRNGGIVFRLDRTDRNAIRVASAGTPITIGFGISRSWQTPDTDFIDAAVSLQKF